MSGEVTHARSTTATTMYYGLFMSRVTWLQGLVSHKCLAPIKGVEEVREVEDGTGSDVYFVEEKRYRVVYGGLEGFSMLGNSIEYCNTKEKRGLLSGILQGISWLHSHGIVHGSLKPANIWVDALKREVKLTGYGLAKFKRTYTEEFDGPLEEDAFFQSPEALQSQEYSISSDVYSFALVLWNFLFQKSAHEMYDSFHTFYKDVILMGDSFEIPQTTVQDYIRIPLPDKLHQILKSSLQASAEGRPTLAAIQETVTRQFTEWIIGTPEANFFWLSCVRRKTHCALTFLCGTHHHRGQQSLVRLIPCDLLPSIIDLAFPYIKFFSESLPVEDVLQEISINSGIHIQHLKPVASLLRGIPVDADCRDMGTIAAERFCYLEKVFGCYFLPKHLPTLHEVCALLKEEWFMPLVTRETAYRFLSNRDRGTFLVRISATVDSTHPFVLSFSGSSGMMNARISRIPGPRYICQSTTADTVPLLIAELVRLEYIQNTCPQKEISNDY
ncbi:hypothetical protein Pelo_6417 [Pelomyxa schiedti]|nr:hypothetical protein Pelo_6417 [Pelomyxa schiedti]